MEEGRAGGGGAAGPAADEHAAGARRRVKPLRLALEPEFRRAAGVQEAGRPSDGRVRAKTPRASTTSRGKGSRASGDGMKPKTAFRIGREFEIGSGVPVDLPRAVQFYQSAAARDFPLAQRALGDCFMFGRGKGQHSRQATPALQQSSALSLSHTQRLVASCAGVEEDRSTAVQWYIRAAGLGDPGATCSLGVCYLHGTGVGEDCARAVKHFRAAAASGLADAQFNLGMCLGQGNGVEKNIPEAVRCVRSRPSSVPQLPSLHSNRSMSSHPGLQALRAGGCAGGGRGDV